MRGIIAYGAYVPYWRLQRGAITAALGTGGGQGTRAVASVRRGHHVDGRGGGPHRHAQRREGIVPSSVYFATADPGLPRQDERHRHPRRARPAVVTCSPATSSARCARSTRAAPRRPLDGCRPTLVLVSDVRTGLPGGGRRARRRRRRRGLALRLRQRRPGASPSSSAAPRPPPSSSTAGARPGGDDSRVWEERFGEHAYVPLVDRGRAPTRSSRPARRRPTSTT